MIPAAFEYHRPDDVAGAVALLQQHGDEARVIAGGHSLIPMMKLRMTAIDHLVDLGAIDRLRGIEIADGTVRLGALVTQNEMIVHAGLTEAAPLVREAALQVADPQVRAMGTIGGNVANGDPGNDMPGLMQCLDATYTLEGPDGEREVRARDFYEAAYFTAREDEEILTAISFPIHARGYAYEKQKRKIGDYATAAAAVLISKEGSQVASASIAMTNLSDVPVWSESAGEALVGTDAGEDAVKAAIEAMLADIDPVEDNRGPVEFKRHVAGIMLRQGISRAFARA